MTDFSKTVYDALVVGSGASGGLGVQAAHGSGRESRPLDAEPPQSDRNFTEHLPAFQLKYPNVSPEVIRKDAAYSEPVLGLLGIQL
jgi:hypothetical protein